MKKFFAFIATLMMMINISIASAAQSSIYPASVVDTADVLTETQIDELSKRIRAVEKRHQIRIGIEFLKTIMGKDETVAANSLLDKNFSGAKNGGILLLVVMDTRKWQLSTDSLMRSRIPNTNSFSNYFLGDLSAGNYYNAASNFIDGVDKYLTYYEQNGAPYDASNEFDPMALMFAVVFSTVCGIMFRSALIGSMSNVRSAITATDYLKRESVKITERQDRFLFKNVSRRPKSKSTASRSNGGGSGGGGGHGGSGGSF